MALTGIEGPLLVPGSPEWLKSMSASKVAVALGLSPYDSPFNLHLTMAGVLNRDDADDDVLKRGHYLEPAIAAWFADQHPDREIATTGTWAHGTERWATASPDRLILTPGIPHRADDGIALLECKSQINGDELWGAELTDEVPIYTRVQCIWQMFVLGARRTHVALLTAFLEFREYVIEYDEAEAAEIVAAARAFMDDVATGVRPPLDDSTHTYTALRALHPDIDGSDCDLTEATAVRYLQARTALKAATAEEQGARNQVADEMGDAKRARWNDLTIANRQVKGEGRPYLVAGRNLPDLTSTNTPTPQESEAA